MREPRWVKVARVVVLAALGVFTLAPIYALVSSSVKPLVDVQSTFRWIPSRLTLRPFVDIWHPVPLGRYFLNSVVVSGVAMACSVTVAIFAAYAVSRYRFPGRGVFSITVLSTQMFPGILFLLPLFIIYVNLGRLTGTQLYASRTGLIITYLTFSLPFSIWMLVRYFDAIPRGWTRRHRSTGPARCGRCCGSSCPPPCPGSSRSPSTPSPPPGARCCSRR